MASTASPHAGSRPSRRSLWLVEAVDALDSRSGLLWTIAGTVTGVGALLAWRVPTLVPPVATIGVAIALAGILLGVAAVVVADSVDRVVRGPRHVRANGGELVAVLPVDASPIAAGDLADAILEAQPAGRAIKIALSAAGTGVFGIGPWAEALAYALARRDVSVLVVDVASGATDRDGLAEVAAGHRRLGDVARLADGMRLARVGPGRDRERAVEALPRFVARLPTDLDVLVVALPPVSTRETVAATACLDHVLVVAERDRTSRVELLSGLDAIARVREPAQVVLLDEPTAQSLRRGSRPPDDRPPRARRRTRSRAAVGVDDGLDDHDAGPDDEPREPSRPATSRDVPSAHAEESTSMRERDPASAAPTAVLGPTTASPGTSALGASTVQDASGPGGSTERGGPADTDVGEPSADAVPDVAPRGREGSRPPVDETMLLDAGETTGGPPVVGGRPDLAPRGLAEQGEPLVDTGPLPAVPETDRPHATAAEVDTGPITRPETAHTADAADAETTAPTETADDDSGPIEPRDVDLLLGAVAAEAAFEATSSADDTADVHDTSHAQPVEVDPRRAADSPAYRTLAEHVATEAASPADEVIDVGPPATDAAEVAEVRSPATDAADVGPDPVVLDAGRDRTDEVDRAVDDVVDVGGASDDEVEDLLRTTAQMAAFMDDLGDRDDDR
jgi:hypothetical protein